MLPEKADKQCCIFDAVSLVKLCEIELGPTKVINWLLRDFFVFIPKLVFDEGLRHISEEDEARTVYLNDIQSCIDYKTDNIYLSFIDDHLSKLSKRDRPKVDDGERYAISLALGASRLSNQYVLLITDDYKAMDLLYSILKTDQIGIIKTSYDLLLFLRSRHSDELPIEVIETALRELTYLLRDNTKPSHQTQKPDNLYIDYKRMLYDLSPYMPGL